MNQWTDHRPNGCDCVRTWKQGADTFTNFYYAVGLHTPDGRGEFEGLTSRWLALPPDSGVEQTKAKPADDLNWRERLEMMVRLAPTVQRMGDYSQGAWPAEIFAAWCCQLTDAMIAEAKKETP